jgi:hypothetical protein
LPLRALCQLSCWCSAPAIHPAEDDGAGSRDRDRTIAHTCRRCCCCWVQRLMHNAVTPWVHLFRNIYVLHVRWPRL